MGLFGISCPGEGDALVNLLLDTFRANILRVPEERLQPLDVVASQGAQTAWRGNFSSLLVTRPRLDLDKRTSDAAGLSNKQSRKVSLDLGLDILDKFLSPFGLGSAGVGLALKGVTEVSFSFSGVKRAYIDKNKLGGALHGHRINPKHASAKIFFGPDAWKLLIVDSVISSNNFSLAVSGSRENQVKIDMGAIQQLVGKATTNISVGLAGKRVISFQGDKQLTFAFTCVHLPLDVRGNIQSVSEDETRRVLAEGRSATAAELQTLLNRPVQISEEPAMITWDNPR